MAENQGCLQWHSHTFEKFPFIHELKDVSGENENINPPFLFTPTIAMLFSGIMSCP